TPSSVSLGSKGSALVGVTLTVPATASGLDSTAFREVGGYVTLTPTAGSNGGSIINVPYYAVTRARADVSAAVLQPFNQRHPSTFAVVENGSGKVNGKADVYSLGGAGDKSLGQLGIRALGVKSAVSGSDRLLTFAFNTNKPNATVDANNISFEVDIFLAGNVGDPAEPNCAGCDYLVYTDDVGRATGAATNGQIGVVVVNNHTGDGIIRFLATAPFDGSLVLLPTLASDVGVTSAEPRFTYQGTSFFFADDPVNQSLLTDQTGKAVFNAFNPSITASVSGTTLPLTLTPGQLTAINLTIDPIEWNVTPTDGVMIVARENPNAGAHNQALLFKVR
ncbi:MAG TPA: hypothetical protein VMK66_10800, partial [Myxococcales bacterium]|nr:hypothetical protein [Myxococcales bacterium]